MALTADQRKSTFGNLHVVHGTYTTTGGTLDLSTHFANIMMFVATATGGIPSAANEPRVSVTAALTVGITDGASGGGTWLALGLRG